MFRTLFITAAAGMLVVSGTAHAQTRSGRKPNIVIVIADDLGYADLGCQGSKDVMTPNIDSIARNGVRFTSGYVTAPICSPTRAGLMTGRYQARFGHEGNPPPGGSQGLPLTQVTIGDRLKALGYATALIGKWHLGSEPQFHPQRRGFDEFFGFLDGGHPYYPDGKKKPAGPILRGTEPVEEAAYLTHAFSREAVAFIERHKRQPFLLMVTYNAVHTPLQSPEKLRKGPENTRKIFVGMMKALDEGVGNILNELRRQELEDDTLIVFLSDNGGPTAETSSSNLPLRGFKEELWEGGLRIPFLMQWRGRLPRGETFEPPVVSLDILPTAVAAAGGTIPADAKLDGVDLLPHLTGANMARPHSVLFWRRGAQWAVRKDDWKLTYVNETSTPHLADLATDIGQKQDVAAQNPAMVRELETLFRAWNADLPPAKAKKGNKK
jgi:arylsulfatase A-like enzyme